MVYSGSSEGGTGLCFPPGFLWSLEILGNPWFVKELVNYFEGNKPLSLPTKEERIAEMSYHYEELLKIKSEKIATMEMRSLASHYIKGVSNSKDFKIGLIKCVTKEQFYQNIKDNLLNKENVI